MGDELETGSKRGGRGDGTPGRGRNTAGPGPDQDAPPGAEEIEPERLDDEPPIGLEADRDDGEGDAAEAEVGAPTDTDGERGDGERGAATYVVRDDFLSGIPQTSLPGGAGPWRAIVGHWSVGGRDLSGWMATVRDVLIPSGRPGGRNVSYHEGWCWNPGTRTFTVSRIVRPDRAAHSMKPVPPPAGPWQPDAVCRALLGDKWRDPNRYTYAVCFAGGPADLAAAEADPEFVRACARRLGELRRQFPSLPDRPIFEHRRGQNNKSDWGRTLSERLYAELASPTPQEDVVESFVVPKVPSVGDVPAGTWLYHYSDLRAVSNTDPAAGPVNRRVGTARTLPFFGEPLPGVALVAYVDEQGGHSGRAYFVKADELRNRRAAGT